MDTRLSESKLPCQTSVLMFYLGRVGGGGGGGKAYVCCLMSSCMQCSWSKIIEVSACVKSEVGA